MRLGIFGGSFDPVHVGHMALAEVCVDEADLDRVWFVPTAQQPFKADGPCASNSHRVAMLEFLCSLLNIAHGSQKFSISTIEIDRGGVSYSIDTLEAVRAQQTEAELFFLMGADSLADFPDWHRPQNICQLATPIVVHREGEPSPDFGPLRQFISAERVKEIESAQIDIAPPKVSSTEIRNLIATGGEWQEFVPPTVANYIQEHKLYSTPDPQS